MIDFEKQNNNNLEFERHVSAKRTFRTSSKQVKGKLNISQLHFQATFNKTAFTSKKLQFNPKFIILNSWCAVNEPETLLRIILRWAILFDNKEPVTIS